MANLLSLRLILDSDSTDFTYGPRDWTVNEQPPWYGGTSTYPEFANAQTLGSFEVTFEGTSIAFTGNTPPITHSQLITVTIDGGTPYNTFYMDPTPQSYRQWFQSPTLSEGQHTIKVDGIDGTSLDYATITVGQNSSLLGKTVIVDNEDPLVHYSGTWTRNPDKFKPGGIPSGLPFRNSTHRTTTPGDSITFQFTGTSAAIYGLFPWGNIGVLAATYTIDDGTPIAVSHPVTTNSPEYVNGAYTVSNFPFFSFDYLSAGDHTLVINVTQCLNHAFAFDYITYSPSFANLASMPRASFTTSPPGSTSISIASSGVASPTTTQVAQKSAGLNKGTLAGIIISGVVVLSLAFAYILYILRRRMSKKNKEHSALKPLQTREPVENSIISLPASLEWQSPANPTHSPPAVGGPSSDTSPASGPTMFSDAMNPTVYGGNYTVAGTIVQNFHNTSQ